MLLGKGNNHVQQSIVSYQAGTFYSNPPGGGHYSTAPISEAIAERRYGDQRIGGQLIGNDHVGSARIVDAHHQDHGRWLRKAVDELVAYTYPHAVGAFH